MMLGFGPNDVWWVGLSAFVAAFAGWFAIKTRLGASWLLRSARRGYLEWHREAVEAYTEPKFETLKAETLAIADTLAHRTFATADDVKREALATADAVRQELLTHTENEEGLIRETVAEVLSPLTSTVNAHVAADQEAFDHIDQVQARQDASLARIEDLLAETPPPA